MSGNLRALVSNPCALRGNPCALSRNPRDGTDELPNPRQAIGLSQMSPALPTAEGPPSPQGGGGGDLYLSVRLCISISSDVRSVYGYVCSCMVSPPLQNL